MRSPFSRRVAGAVLAVGLAASLAACTGSDPKPTALPSKSEPVFASDEEAFAAGEAAFAKFTDAMQAVSDNGGGDTSGLEDVAMGEALEAAIEAAKGYESSGWHTSGESIVAVQDRVQYFETRDRGAVIQMYFCEDISGVDVLDSNGDSVVGEGATIIPNQVVIEGTSAEGLKVSEWLMRGTFCPQS